MDNKWAKGLVVAAGMILLMGTVAMIVGVTRNKAR